MFTLPLLSYSYDSLEPFIDSKTMLIHHTKHHQAYIDKLNAWLDSTEYASWPIEKLLTHIDQVPQHLQTIIKNHGWWHYNHSLFWSIMIPWWTHCSQSFSEIITSQFWSFDQFKETFTQAAVAHFGSWWTWLVKDRQWAMSVISLPNQDSPLMQGMIPLMGIDIWEHAYYLLYQNRRIDYINAWRNIVNWDRVEQYYHDSSTK